MFKIDQDGRPAGQINRSRTDGSLTGTVTLTYVGIGTFRPRFLWVPLGDTGGINTLHEDSPGVWKFTPTGYKPGTYRIEGIENEGKPSEKRLVRLFRIRTANGLIIPAYGERANLLANIQNATQTQIDESEDNALDYLDPALNQIPWAGWLKGYLENLKVLDAALNQPLKIYVGASYFGIIANWKLTGLVSSPVLSLSQSGSTTNFPVVCEINALIPAQAKTITEIGLIYNGSSGHVALPATMPSFKLQSVAAASVSVAPDPVDLISVVDASGTVPVFQNAHQILGTASPGIAIDMTSYRYFLRIEGESGTNSIVDCQIPKIWFKISL